MTDKQKIIGMMCTALQRLRKAYMRHQRDCAEDRHTKNCLKMVFKGEEYPVALLITGFFVHALGMGKVISWLKWAHQVIASSRRRCDAKRGT